MTVSRASKRTIIIAFLLAGLLVAGIKAFALVVPGDVPVNIIDLAGTDYAGGTSGSRTVVALGWGGGTGDVGKAGGVESALVGPSSFTVSETGEIHLLDQVNKRVSVFASTGRRVQDIELPISSAQEIQTGNRGEFYVLDAERDPKVYHFAGGALKRTVPVSRDKARSARYPAITGLSVEGKKVAVEFGHEQAIELTDEVGREVAPREQEVAPFTSGRRVKGINANRVVSEEVAPDHVTLLVTSAQGDPVFRVRIKSERLIDSIQDIQSDRAGNYYVLIHLMKPNTSSNKMDGADALVLASFGPTGTFRGQIDMPYGSYSDRFRELTVTENGEVYQMQTSPNGLKIVAWPALER